MGDFCFKAYERRLTDTNTMSENVCNREFVIWFNLQLDTVECENNNGEDKNKLWIVDNSEFMIENVLF